LAAVAWGIRQTERLGPARLPPGRSCKDALIYGDPDAGPPWTYADLLADAERAARALLTSQAGERVAVRRKQPDGSSSFGPARRADLVTSTPPTRATELAPVAL